MKDTIYAIMEYMEYPEYLNQINGKNLFAVKLYGKKYGRFCLKYGYWKPFVFPIIRKYCKLFNVKIGSELSSKERRFIIKKALKSGSKLPSDFWKEELFQFFFDMNTGKCIGDFPLQIVKFVNKNID